jgi:hypothetical protein
LEKNVKKQVRDINMQSHLEKGEKTPFYCEIMRKHADIARHRPQFQRWNCDDSFAALRYSSFMRAELTEEFDHISECLVQVR